MAKASFTYEVRKLPTEPVWVEDYVVRTSEGDSVGTVGAVLEREGKRLLLVQRGLVPAAQERLAVPWEEVERVDHDAVAVWLRLDEQAFLDRALELDPARGVEEGRAEARRLTEAPPEELPRPEVRSRGPVDRSLSVVAVVLGGLAAFSFLVIAVAITATDSAWPMLLFVVTAALAVAAGITGYRAYRSPYRKRGAQKS